MKISKNQVYLLGVPKKVQTFLDMLRVEKLYEKTLDRRKVNLNFDV